MTIALQIKKKLHSFDLNIQGSLPDGVTAILGASGSGKSMTISSIAGIQTPDEGQIIINGRPVFDSHANLNLPARKRRVGMLFQGNSLFPNMTVQQNIASAIRANKKVKKAIVSDFLDRFQIADLSLQYPHTLSGGQAQRVALARMLAGESETVLLDEPFSALDASLKWKMEEELADLLHDLPGTIVFVTHDRDEAYRVADYIAVFDQGKIDFFGSKSDLMNAPTTLASAQLSGCKNTSKVKTLGAGFYKSTDWSITLYKPNDIPYPVGHIGIRAHYVRPALEEETINTFYARLDRYSESPFSWLISLKTLDNDGALLYWILDKSNHAPTTGGRNQEDWLASHQGQVMKMAIDPEGILILQ